MRTTFVRTLETLAKDDSSIWLVTGDLGFTVLENFRDTFPNQYLNAGVAEQNLIGTAAGLALSGKKVFVYSIIPFITFRCLEQIRNDICYHKLPVCVVGVGAGYSYGHQGATHHAIEDIAIMRALPGMTVVCPGDPVETEAAVKAIAAMNGPCYLRLGKAGEPRLHEALPDFTIGKAIQMRDGADATLIATSTMLETAVKVVDQMKEAGMTIRLLSMPTVKPIDADAIERAAKETSFIVTLEEHESIGGLGSAVSEILSTKDCRTRHLLLSTPPAFADAIGSTNFLRQRAGIDVESVMTRIQQFKNA